MLLRLLSCLFLPIHASFYLFALSVFCEPLSFDIKGDAAILINAESGAILFEKNAHTALYPASTTKIATALFALSLLKNNDLQTLVVAEPESLKKVTEATKKKLDYQMPGYWLEPDGTNIRLQPYEELSYQNLLEGMLIPSGNDAANVIAQALGPTIPVFVTKLNQFLKEQGCVETTYYNPHGLHHPEHVTTAYDLAHMTAIALKNPVFCDIVKKTRFQRPQTNLQLPATFLQGNRLLRAGQLHYAPAIGVKTGYHSKAKKTFVGAAQIGDRRLILVLLGYKDKNAIFEQAINIFDTAFNQSQVEQTFLRAGPQNYHLNLPHAKNKLLTHTVNDLTMTYYPAEESAVKCYLKWELPVLPIKKNQKVGELYLMASNEKIINKVDLLALQSVKKAWPYNWLGNLENFYINHPFISISYLLLLLCCIGFSFWFVKSL